MEFGLYFESFYKITTLLCQISIVLLLGGIYDNTKKK